MRFRELNPALGAEVLDVDLMTEPSPRDIDELRGAFDTYHLLLIRNGRPIPPERHMEIARWFGPEFDCTGSDSWSTMDNENASGSIRLRFHSDHTYTDTPIKIISLHALQLPGGGTTTSFASGAHAWASLAPERQELLSGLTARHRHKFVSLGDADNPEFRADHPVCLRHPRTEMPILFVTESHTDAVYGLDREDSDQLLAELTAHLYSPDTVYVHEWRLHDFVIWDNLALQHARTREVNRSEGRRLLQRVALNEATFAELLERARTQERERQLQGA